MGRRIVILATAVLAFGVLISSATVAAQDTDSDTRAASYNVAACRSLYTEDPGTYRVGLPKWCRGGRCEIFGEWGGANVGAFAPGLTWAVNYIQFPYSAIPNQWVSGPNIALGGALLGSDGFGRNGDRNYETILGPWMTSDGSYFVLTDDSGFERKSNYVSFTFVKKGNDMDYAKIHICRG